MKKLNDNDQEAKSEDEVKEIMRLMSIHARGKLASKTEIKITSGNGDLSKNI